MGYRYNVEILMRGVSLAVAVTPEISSQHPELHVALGAFDCQSTSKKGEYNGFLEDNYNRVDLAGLQMQIVQGRKKEESKTWGRLQTNIQLKNEPLSTLTKSTKPTNNKTNNKSNNKTNNKTSTNKSKSPFTKKGKKLKTKKSKEKNKERKQPASTSSSSSPSSSQTPQQRFVMDIAQSVILLQPGVVLACNSMIEMYGHHVSRYQLRRKQNKRRFYLIDQKIREVMHLTGNAVVDFSEDQTIGEDNNNNNNNNNHNHNSQNRQTTSNTSTSKSNNRNNKSTRRTSSTSDKNNTSNNTSNNSTTNSTNSKSTSNSTTDSIKQTMKGVSLRISVRDTCLALLEGTTPSQDSTSASNTILPKVRVESALVIRLDRLACHHTSETTKQSQGQSSHQVMGTVIAVGDMQCTVRRHLPSNLFVTTTEEKRKRKLKKLEMIVLQKERVQQMKQEKKEKR